jgi:hypothetical protein
MYFFMKYFYFITKKKLLIIPPFLKYIFKINSQHIQELLVYQ